MMKLTSALKGHVVQKGWAKQEDSDDVFKSAIGSRIVSGDLTVDEVQALSQQEVSDGEKKLNDMVVKAVGSALEPILARLSQAGGMSAPAGTNPAPGAAQKAFSLAAQAGAVGSDGERTQVEVLKEIHRYDDTRTAATGDKSHNTFMRKSFGGVQLTSAGIGGNGYALDMPTQRQKAIAGAWFKLMLRKAFLAKGMPVPEQYSMTEHDRKLCEYAANECRFVGPIGYKGGDHDSEAADAWFEGERLKDHSRGDLWVKTVLDDTTSGGLYAVPIEFDAAVILTPILNGELFPFVTVRNVTRRRIEATKIGNPTLTWGGQSGTSVSLFDTDSYVSAFDNNIYVVDGAIELGRDFLSDSPLDVGGIVQERFGQKFLQELDNVIAIGDGTTQPEGLFTASGVTANTPGGGSGAAPQVGDYEQLMHGIAKEYQQEAGLPPNSRMMFIGTQTSYQRARSIKVNSSSDERRIFGQDNQMDYRLMDLRYAINASVGNAKLGCFCMNRYRMYRRLGLDVQVVTGDVYSVRRNTQTIVVRARFGGALEQSAAGVKITTAQS